MKTYPETLTYADLLASCIDDTDLMTRAAMSSNAKLTTYDNVTVINCKYRLSSVVESLRSLQQARYLRDIDPTTTLYAVFNVNSRKYYNEDGEKTFYISESCFFKSIEDADWCCDYLASDMIVSIMRGSKTGHHYFGDFVYANRESIESLVEYKELTND